VSGTPGIYAYTLTCSGPGGSGSSKVQITVMPPNGSDCGVGVPTTNIVGPEASATGAVNGGIGGLLCLGCSVSNPGYLTDSSTSNYATMVQPVGLLGTTSLTVNGTVLYPAGRKVGFVLTEGNGLLSTTLLQGVTVDTLLGGVVQESATIGGLLNLDALGLIAVNPNAGFASFTTTKPFDSLAIVAGSVLSVIATYHVYDACVSLQ
jgi:PKD repeat protein